MANSITSGIHKATKWSIVLRPVPGSGWLLFDGIVTLVLAVMIGWTHGRGSLCWPGLSRTVSTWQFAAQTTS